MAPYSYPRGRDAILLLSAVMEILGPAPASSGPHWPQDTASAAPMIDGDDMLILSRTPEDAPNQHDSERLTLHRIPGFR